MTRFSKDIYEKGLLWTGFDYKNQCWVVEGIIQECGHPDGVGCSCYGRMHAGERSMCREMTPQDGPGEATSKRAVDDIP